MNESAKEFQMSEAEIKAAQKWIEQHLQKCHIPIEDVGAVGGRWSYCFTPTSIETTVKVCCLCGESFDVTDYSG